MWADNAICICCLSQKFLQVGLLLLYKCDLCVWRVGCGIFCIERSGIVTLSLSNAGNVFGGYLTIFGGVGPLVSISWKRFHTTAAVFQSTLVVFERHLLHPCRAILKYILLLCYTITDAYSAKDVKINSMFLRFNDLCRPWTFLSSCHEIFTRSLLLQTLKELEASSNDRISDLETQLKHVEDTKRVGKLLMVYHNARWSIRDKFTIKVNRHRARISILCTP